jgi:hypothetical protein
MHSSHKIIASTPTACLVAFSDEGRTSYRIHFSSTEEPAPGDFDAMVLAAVEHGIPLPENGFVVELEEAFGDGQGDRVLLALI